MAGDSSSTMLQALNAIQGMAGPVVGLGAIFGLMQLEKALSGGPKRQTQVFRQAIPPKWRAYGEGKKAGALAFFAADTGFNRLEMVVLTHYGRMQKVVKHYFNADPLILVGGTGQDWSTDSDVVTGPAHYRDGGRYCRIDVKPGSEDQTELERLHGYFPTRWTESHKLTGIAVSLVDLLSPDADKVSTVFPNGPPAYAEWGQFSLVFDPREAPINVVSYDTNGTIHTYTDHGLQGAHVDTNGKWWPGDYVFVRGLGSIVAGRYTVRTAPSARTLTLRTMTDADLSFATAGTGGAITVMRYSKNAALCLLDYLTHPAGMDIPWEFFDGALGSVAANDWGTQANICDRIRSLVNGGTEPWFSICGGYELTESPKDVLARMLAAVDGRIFLRGDGYIVLDVANFSEPTITFTDDNILDWNGFQRSKDPAEIKNRTTGKFVSKEYFFEESEADPWLNQSSIGANGERVASLDLSFCPSHAQARQILKIESSRGDPEWSGTLILNANGLRSIGERIARITSVRHGIDATFEVVNGPNLELMTGNCTIELSRMPIEASSWVKETDNGTPPVSTAFDQGMPDELPVGLTVTVASRVLTATWTAPSNTGLDLNMRWRASDDSIADDDATWTDFGTINKSGHTATSGTLPAASAYDVRMAYSSGYPAYVRSVQVT